MKTSYKISIIIPTHKRPKLLQNLLESILRAIPHKLTYEVLVVSNIHDQNVKNLCENTLNAKYYSVGRIGANSARNLGLRVASGEIIFFFDDDCLMSDVQLIEKHLRIHNKLIKHAGIGGVYVPTRSSTPAGLAHWDGMMRWLVKVPNPLNTGRLIGGHASYKRQFIQDIFFDEEIEYGSAEISFNQTVFEFRGALGLFPDLKLEHSFELTEEEMMHKCKLQAINYAKFASNKSFKSIHPIEVDCANSQSQIIDEMIENVVAQLSASGRQTFEILKKTKSEFFWSIYKNALSGPNFQGEIITNV